MGILRVAAAAYALWRLGSLLSGITVILPGPRFHVVRASGKEDQQG